MIHRVKPMSRPTASKTGTKSQPLKRKAYGKTTEPPPTKTFNIVTTVPHTETPEETSTSLTSLPSLPLGFSTAKGTVADMGNIFEADGWGGQPTPKGNLHISAFIVCATAIGSLQA